MTWVNRPSISLRRGCRSGGLQESPNTFLEIMLEEIISLHHLNNGERMNENARVRDPRTLVMNHWRAQFLPCPAGRGSAAHY